MPSLVFSAQGVSESPARTSVSTRGFHLVVDEPPALGGEDIGANPVEYLLAALLGCLNVVCHLVAKERGIDIKRLRLEAEGPLDPARLFGDPQAARAGFQEIRVTLHLESDATAEALTDWLEEVERRCPVSDNLTQATPIHLALA
ncbi:MAG: OsmC family protein [Fimbriimonadaceae bacterium]|nr:OsmC family protein [Fimbriimonadaceae bacterium]